MTKHMTNIIIAGLTVLLLAATFGAATPVAAQDPDCIIREYKLVTVQFGNNKIYDLVLTDEYWDPACVGTNDGRENYLDAAASGAIYCTDEGNISIYDINHSGDGEKILEVPPSAVNAARGAVGETVLIDEAGGFRLYKLSSGELQLNAPPIYSTDPEYVYIWNGCES